MDRLVRTGPLEHAVAGQIVREAQPDSDGEFPPDSYVAFKRRATPSFRHEVTRCVDFREAMGN